VVRIDYLADHPEMIPILANWHHSQWGYLNPGRAIEHYIASLEKQLGRKQVPTAFVALARDNSPLGSASLVTFDMDTKMELTPWLASVFVDPEHRDKRIGSALVRRVMEEAREIGIDVLYLFTPDRENFYARLGWEVLERTVYRRESVVIMSIRLVG
jgi:N-acetylglutamate synthase-like GNAT family acetyltransferase